MVSPARAEPPFPVESLPDDVLALVFRSLAQTSFRHALVSKRWLRLATSALSHLTIRHRELSTQEIRDSEHSRNAQLAWLSLPRLLSALRRFPTLTHVSLSEYSIVSADGDALFQCLAATCPFLSHLTVEHKFRMAVTVDGLESLFRGCRKLRELRLLTTDSLPHLPPSLSLLTDLQTLHVCAHPRYGDDSFQELVSLPESIGALQQLRELRIRAGASFQRLGECVGLLTNLRKLSPAREPGLAEKVIIGALFSVMEVISLPLLTVRELIESSSAATHASAGAESGSPVAAAFPLLLVVVVLLMPLLPSAWLYPAMLLAAALLLVILVPIRAFDVASNGTEQHPGLFSLTILKVSDCPLISSLPKNFSFPALHTLTLHSLGVPKDLLDLSSRQLPQLQRLVLERMGAEADPWLFDRIPGVRSGRMRLFLHVKALFVLLHVVDLLLQLVVLLMRAGCS
ncbi:unnamed protein product [Closterium sp. Naga37s-1]|nr:unnamed protein product [Closterium sp. Naga37s-1]